MMNKTLYFCHTCIKAYKENKANNLEDFNTVICVINISVLVLVLLYYIEFVFYFSTLVCTLETEDDK